MVELCDVGIKEELTFTLAQMERDTLAQVAAPGRLEAGITTRQAPEWASRMGVQPYTPIGLAKDGYRRPISIRTISTTITRPRPPLGP